MKRIVFSEEAKADIRAIPQHIAMNILAAIHRLAESGAGRVKALQGDAVDKRLRFGDYRVHFTFEHPIPSASTPSRTARMPIGETRRGRVVCRRNLRRIVFECPVLR